MRPEGVQPKGFVVPPGGTMSTYPPNCSVWSPSFLTVALTSWTWGGSIEVGAEIFFSLASCTAACMTAGSLGASTGAWAASEVTGPDNSKTNAKMASTSTAAMRGCLASFISPSLSPSIRPRSPHEAPLFYARRAICQAACGVILYCVVRALQTRTAITAPAATRPAATTNTRTEAGSALPPPSPLRGSAATPATAGVC
jgi:hypothetical protein